MTSSSTLRTAAQLLLLAVVACFCATTAVAQPPPTFNGDTPDPVVALSPTGRAPEVFHVTLVTNVKYAIDASAAVPVVIEVHRAWAPRGVDRFWQLCTLTAPASNRGAKPLPRNTTFFTDGAFFRVVPHFVVQFGINGVPALNRPWTPEIADDTVLHSNVRGTLTYAAGGPDTRTTQVFINLVDNKSLDRSGFAPIGRVVTGMTTVDAIYNPTPGVSGGISQGDYTSMGNKWLLAHYPETNRILSSFVTTTTPTTYPEPVPPATGVTGVTISEPNGGGDDVVKVRVGRVDIGRGGDDLHRLPDDSQLGLHPRYHSRFHHRNESERRHRWIVWVTCAIILVVAAVSVTIIVRQRQKRRHAAQQHIQSLQNQRVAGGVSGGAQVILAPPMPQQQQPQQSVADSHRQQMQQPFATQQHQQQIQYPQLSAGAASPQHI